MRNLPCFADVQIFIIIESSLSRLIICDIQYYKNNYKNNKHTHLNSLDQLKTL